MSPKLQPYEQRVRRLLLLIPAARAAEGGLPLARALELTGARSAEELIGDIEAVQGLAVSPEADATHLLVEVERGRVIVDLEMGFGRPPPLSAREGAALLAALRPFRGEGGRTAVDRAARKIEKAVPDHLKREVADLQRGVDLAIAPPGPWADALEEAISARREVAVEYRSESDGSFARKLLEPRALFPRQGAWYLVAWSVEKEEEHLYRLDRMSSVLVGERGFGEHKGPPLDRLARRRLYFESGSERRIELRFAPELARLARERGFEGTAAADGSLRASFEATPNEFLYGLLLGWGGGVEVLGPPEVRDGLRRRVEALRARYA
ncbi:MAG TPA: WYL domain-containing protein [Anaeromyxobacteraceae bacterium]|nr:WYL domain-containing protein [Anaeromyxobacteraceae bacterium]